MKDMNFDSLSRMAREVWKLTTNEFMGFCRDLYDKFLELWNKAKEKTNLERKDNTPLLRN